MDSKLSLSLRSLADRVGILVSALCAIHCALGPILLAAGAALPFAFLAEEGLHELLLWAIVPAAVLAFGLGCRRHKDLWVLVLGLLGLVGIVSSVLAREVVGETGERVLAIASAGLLIVAHVRNFNRCRDTDCHPE